MSSEAHTCGMSSKKKEMCLALYFSTFLFNACTLVFYRQINDPLP